MRRLLALALVVLSVRAAPTADAHAEIFESDPAANGVAPEGLDEITMTFVSLDTDRPVTVAVLDAHGDDHALGPPTVSPRDSSVTVAVDPLAPGLYTVRWRATSADGDGLSEGMFTFDVEPGAGGGAGVVLLWLVAVGIPVVLYARYRWNGHRGRRDR